MPTKPPQLVTVGVIASELGVSVDRVSRILRARPHIQPRAYAANTRLFDNVAIAQVRHELTSIEARRGHEATVVTRTKGGTDDSTK